MSGKRMKMILIAFFVIVIICFGIQAKKIPFVCYREGEISLTFDQGPSYYTGHLLNILSKEGVKAAFHVTADYLDNPIIMAYLRKAVKDGHLIGLYIKETVMNDEVATIEYIRKMSAKLKPYTGQEVNFLRFAHPGPSSGVLAKILSAGYRVTAYNLDSNDFSFKNASKADATEGVVAVFREMLQSIMPPARGSFISVQRDLLDYSVAATEKIIKLAKKKEYNFVRLDACISTARADGDGIGGGGFNEKDEGIIVAESAATALHSDSTGRLWFIGYVFATFLWFVVG